MFIGSVVAYLNVFRLGTPSRLLFTATTSKKKTYNNAFTIVSWHIKRINFAAKCETCAAVFFVIHTYNKYIGSVHMKANTAHTWLFKCKEYEYICIHMLCTTLIFHAKSREKKESAPELLTLQNIHTHIR